MYFSPQRRAIFQHLNFKKCSEPPQFFSIFTSKCASRHSGVQFLISPLTTRLRTRRFNEPTFRLTRHTNHSKNTAFRDFSNIWRGCIFFLLTFPLLHLLSSGFTSSSDFTLLWLYFIYLLFICFSTLHSVGSLLFKLPSTKKHSVLQSTTPYYKVLLRTTKYYSVLQSITPHYKVLLQYYKVLLQCYSILQSNTPVLQSTTPVLMCTTKYYSSTTKYYSSTTLCHKILFQHYSVVQSTTLY